MTKAVDELWAALKEEATADLFGRVTDPSGEQEHLIAIGKRDVSRALHKLAKAGAE